MQNELARTIDYAGLKAQYDMQCKKVLAQKEILSRILKGTMEEFQNMSLMEIEACIEGKPEISVIPVLPGETNKGQIAGLPNEEGIVGEGTVFFDIRFAVYIPRLNEKQKIMINLEAQKDFDPGYEIVTRAIFYGSRLISAQYGTEFVNSDYDSVKKVYSIWICMNAPNYIGNTIANYSIQKTEIFGHQPTQKEAYDKMSVVIVTLNEKTDAEELTGMLNTLLSSNIQPTVKKKILEEEYHIPMHNEMEKEVNVMCNLSDLVEEKGIEKGVELMIKALLKNGKVSDADIAEAAEISMEQLEMLKKRL